MDGYRAETDQSTQLAVEEASYYQSLIGILRWIVELGRIDICCEVSMLSSCMALPREGHLGAVLHLFAYLKSHRNAPIVFDPSYPAIDGNDFQKQDWSNTIYAFDGLEELIPGDAPTP